jgi:hypothetical protein
MNPYDSVQSVQLYGFGTKIEKYWARISILCSLFLGRTKHSVQLTMGTKNELEEAGQWYIFGTKNEAYFRGTNLVL